MLLAELLNNVSVTKLFSMLYGRMVQTQDLSIRSIQYDSRRVEHGDLFVAIPGTAVDGHRFIDNAIANGAVAVVMQDDAAVSDHVFLHAGVMKIVVSDARKTLAIMSGNFYHRPSERLILVGVTGTNGKTTTTHLIRAILEARGDHVGLIGTIEYRIGNEVIAATHTTPESLEIHELLDRMVQRGCTAAVMEVSSHALTQSRVYGMAFRTGVFTNLTQDHLDYHGSMESYGAAKKILFDGLGQTASAVINADDPWGDRMVSGTTACTLRYGMGNDVNFRASSVRMKLDGMTFLVEDEGTRIPVRSRLTGRFNVANILAAYAAGKSLGCRSEQIVAGIAAMPAVRGRFEQVVSPLGWTAIIDYAHTPDALENCLRTVRDILSEQGHGRIITLFGCGGNRDRGKRPMMGRIASTMSDMTIVTSDNPRNEDPHAIIRDILGGVDPAGAVYSEADRRKAIIQALGHARAGDVVVIAGKGHETYQVVGVEHLHFDDREEVESFLRVHG
jgi:UDP-N-acetylmuramoyl-L-alanyl-D-glutamate--2,6-diaminopimelate ligase